MNLKRVYLGTGETTFVVALKQEFCSVHDTFAYFDRDRPLRYIMDEMQVHEFRVDGQMHRPGAFVGVSPSGFPITRKEYPWRVAQARPDLVTIQNPRERTRFCGYVKVLDVTGQTPRLQLSDDWHETSICYDSERAAFKYPGWTPYKIAEGYFAYVDHK